jgi:hypothetical protein
MDQENNMPEFNKVRYLSEQLDIRKLALADPDFLGGNWREIDSMLELERACVEIGFRGVRTTRDRASAEIEAIRDGLTVKQIESDLCSYYVRFGLAEGKATARMQVAVLKNAGAGLKTQPRK